MPDAADDLDSTMVQQESDGDEAQTVAEPAPPPRGPKVHIIYPSSSRVAVTVVVIMVMVMTTKTKLRSRMMMMMKKKMMMMMMMTITERRKMMKTRKQQRATGRVGPLTWDGGTFKL